MKHKDLQDSNLHPFMVKWFNIKTLIGAAKKALISAMFGTYADGRLVQAVLDNSNEGNPIDIKSSDLPYEESEEIWIDFVADVGDGFDSTYAIAYWLSQPEIEINGKITKRGEILLLGGRYGAIIKSWRNNWEKIIPFFDYPKDIRRTIYTTNIIESLNHTLRKAVKTRGHFPTEDAVFKVFYLAIRGVSKK